MARILVVDDQPDTLLEMRAVLVAAGYEVVLAADAEQAAERLAAAPVDLIAVDVAMPTGDGWAVLALAGRSLEPVPVLVVSDRATARQRQRAGDLGAVGGLGKAQIAHGLAGLVAERLDRARPAGR